MKEKLLSNASKSDHQIALEVEEFLEKEDFYILYAESHSRNKLKWQLQSYSSGASKPRKRQICRIEDGIKSIASELGSLMFK